MKKKKLLSWVLTLMLALSIFSIPTAGYAATEDDMLMIEWYIDDLEMWSIADGADFDTADKPFTSQMKYQLRAAHLDDSFETTACTGTTVEWTSDNPNVAAVENSNGQPETTVTVKGTGEATITAKCGDQTAEFNIYVPIEYNNALYVISKDNKATLLKTSRTGWNGTIPQSVSGAPVTVIEQLSSYDDDNIDGIDGTTTITIPASVTDIDVNAFLYVKNLKAINVASSNTAYYSIDGVLFSNSYYGDSYKTLHTYPVAKTGTRYTIPGGTQKVSVFALDSEHPYLKEVVVPTSMEIEFGDAPFSSCCLEDEEGEIIGWSIKLLIMGSNPTFEEYATDTGIPWERYAVDITGGTLALSSTKAAYTGKAVTPAVTVTVGGKTLKNGTDYTVAYKNNVNPGTATATVTGKGAYKGTLTKNFTIAAPSVAAVKSVTANLDKSKYNSVRASWSAVKVAGATVKYKVEYKVGSGKWKTAAKGTTKTSYTVKGLAAGKKVTVRVKPSVVVNGKTYSAAAKSSSGVYTLKKLNKPSVKKASKTKIKVSWNNINGETGYEIYKSTKKNKNYKPAKTVKSAKAKSATFKVTKKKTYYYKVRAYKTVKVGGKTYKVYGPWSPVKSFKLK